MSASDELDVKAPVVREMNFVIPTRTDSFGVYGPKQGEWTADDWEQLDHTDKRYEVIEGVLYVFADSDGFDNEDDIMSTAPSFFHQWAIKRFERYVGTPAEDKKLAIGMFSPVGVFMPGCAPVQPDYVVVRWNRLSIIRDRRIYDVPDLILEVLSSNREYDETTKLKAYAKAGVPEYVIIDLAARSLKLHSDPSGEIYKKSITFKDDDIVSFTCMTGISVKLSVLFADSPDSTL